MALGVPDSSRGSRDVRAPPKKPKPKGRSPHQHEPESGGRGDGHCAPCAPVYSAGVFAGGIGVLAPCPVRPANNMETGVCESGWEPIGSDMRWGEPDYASCAAAARALGLPMPPDNPTGPPWANGRDDKYLPAGPRVHSGAAARPAGGNLRAQQGRGQGHGQVRGADLPRGRQSGPLGHPGLASSREQLEGRAPAATPGPGRRQHHRHVRWLRRSRWRPR